MPLGSSAVPLGPTTTAAAAESCVEKMLQLAQRTSAPSSARVSMSTAVCTVMCSEPAIRAPASGFLPLYRSRRAISPGISCSASRISFRPSSLRLRSRTLKSSPLYTSAVSECRPVVFVLGAFVRLRVIVDTDASPESGLVAEWSSGSDAKWQRGRESRLLLIGCPAVQLFRGFSVPPSPRPLTCDTPSRQRAPGPWPMCHSEAAAPVSRKPPPLPETAR